MCLPHEAAVDAVLQSGDSIHVQSVLRSYPSDLPPPGRSYSDFSPIRVPSEFMKGALSMFSASRPASPDLSSINGPYSEDKAIDIALQQQATLTPPPAHYESWTSSPTKFPPSIPTNDVIGNVICSGTVSQYFWDGGRSACTSVCLVASERILSCQDLSSLSGTELDDIVQQGVCKHQELGASHSGLDDLWKLPVFQQVLSSLDRGAPFQACVSPSSSQRTPHLHDEDNTISNAYFDALRHTSTCVRSDEKGAALLTTSGETVLCFQRGGHWYLFDSHGQSHEHDKKVYIKQFDTMHALASGLMAKYPPQDFGDESLMSEMYNTFEAHPLVLVEHRWPDVASRDTHMTIPNEKKLSGWDPDADLRRTVELSKDLFRAIELSKETSAKITDDKCMAFFEPSAKPVLSSSPTKWQPVPSNTEESSSQHSPTFQHDVSLVEKDDFVDPILVEVIADPVSCADGYTYKRSSLERHFRIRRETEEARQTEEERRDRGEPTDQNDQPDEGVACCGQRRRIQLISPMTQEVLLSDDLIPNRNLERQIVRLVEMNALGMSEENIQSCNEKREAKRVNDRVRNQQRREWEDNQQRMQEQAEQAGERRETERQTAENTASRPPLGNEGLPCDQVRLDRNVRSEGERLAVGDLGISVALCEKGDRISTKYITSFGLTLRCMVACCINAFHTNGHSSCARCGRLVCELCLAFGVTDIKEFNPTQIHRICSDCVTQVLGAMNPSESRMKQTREIVQWMYLEPHMTNLANQAAALQDQVVHSETWEQYQPRHHAVLQEINSLEDRRHRLRTQIQRAHDDTARTRRDASRVSFDGTGGLEGDEVGEVKALQEQYILLQEQLLS